MADEGWNDGNRAFLQALMSRGSMTFSQGQQVLAAIFTIEEGKQTLPEQVTREDFESYIAAAADKVSPFDYEIRSTQHQLTKERTHALVNATSDALTQLATTRTPEEMLFVRRVIDAMFETYNTRRREVMAITSMQALERKITKGVGGGGSGGGGGPAAAAAAAAASQRGGGGDGGATVAADKGVTNDQAERTLNGLVTEGWFERSSEGWYTLSPRALLELQTWLVAEYNDDGADADDWRRIKFCEACKGIVTVGRRCADLECPIRLHDICQDAFLSSRPGRECPRCRTAWDGRHFVGQRAITTTEDYLKGKRRSQNHRGRDVEVEAEEEED